MLEELQRSMFGDVEDAVERIKTMLQQEQVYFSSWSHVSQHHQTSEENEGPAHMRRACREIVTEWCSRIIAHLDIPPGELISTTMFFVDKFFDKSKSTASDRSSEEDVAFETRAVKLVTATSLLLAIKLNFASEKEQKANRLMKVLPSLLEGEFSPRQIVSMEMLILRMLGFRVNPPMVASFVHEYMILLKAQFAVGSVSIHNHMLLESYSLAIKLAELAVRNFILATAPPSAVAQAAVLVAISLVAKEVQYYEKQNRLHNHFLNPVDSGIISTEFEQGATSYLSRMCSSFSDACLVSRLSTMLWNDYEPHLIKSSIQRRASPVSISEFIDHVTSDLDTPMC